MSHLTSLTIQHFRNLKNVDITLQPELNVFYGNNGAGKTSFLEAIHYLAVGKSFRTHVTPRLIQDDKQHFSIFSRIQDDESNFFPLGVERFKSGQRHLKYNGDIITRLSTIARKLPTRVISAMSHRFLHDGPKTRRQFLDWLLFHGDHNSYIPWQNIQRCLKQRNAALKQHLPIKQVVFWDNVLVTDTLRVHQSRIDIIERFRKLFNQLCKVFLPNYPIQIEYYCGWDSTQCYSEQLKTNFSRDSVLGYTTAGPHRADLKLLIEGIPAHDILSQGQQKLLTYALYLSQGLLLQQQTQNRTIYLIDDLPAELDSQKQQAVLEILTNIKAQVLITCIDIQEMQPIFAQHPMDSSVFHVKQGQILTESTK